MIKSLIVAHGKNNQIGQDNKLLWHIPEDLKYFKSITDGKSIIMGRKTFESLPGILPNRNHIIISKTLKSASKYTVFDSLEKAFDHCEQNEEEEVVVIGGAQIYKLALPYIDKMYVSEVDYEGKADTFMPDYNDFNWKTNIAIDNGNWVFKIKTKKRK